MQNGTKPMGGCVLGGALAPYLFFEGTNFHAEEYLGVRTERTDGGIRLFARCFVPGADRVTLCCLDGDAFAPLQLSAVGGGIFEGERMLASPIADTAFRYEADCAGRRICFGDPFCERRAGTDAFFLPDGTAPRKPHPSRAWAKQQRQKQGIPTLLKITFDQLPGATPEKAAAELAAAAKARGCTYILLREKDAPGTPDLSVPPRPGADGLMRFCTACHRCGVGVLLEGQTPRFHVRSFARYRRAWESVTVSCAIRRLERYGADGLVFTLGSTLPERVISFYQKLTAVVSDRVPDALLVASVGEDASALAAKPIRDGGLGFHRVIRPAPDEGKAGTENTIPKRRPQTAMENKTSDRIFFETAKAPDRLRVQVLHPRVKDGKLTVGAIPGTGRVTFRVSVSYGTAVTGGELLLYRDTDGRRFSVPLSWEAREGDTEQWSCTKEVSPLCQDGATGLFFYRFRLHTAWGDRYLGVVPGTVRPMLCENEEESGAYYLTVYDPAFRTPQWLRGGVMYQIFPDRFAKGQGPVGEKPGAVLRDDWDGEIGQYGERPGDFVRNNEFFGGNLWGVVEHLDYLKSLGVDCIYLCPIFCSPSNHRYDTADYGAVDPLLGTDEAFRALADAACERGISVILDGVFDHTGDDSPYFNAKGTYSAVGAAQSKESPYYEWFRFRNWPDDYECWWGVRTMPQIDTRCRSFRDYICGENGIVRRWQRLGAAGFRLDVADELSPEFLEELRTAVKSESENAILFGEVWEDASDKIAYGERRRYFRGRQLDSVMNYPVRDAILHFLKTGDAQRLRDTVEVLYSHYPRGVSSLLMNLIGSHDTERVLTVLGGDEEGDRGGSALRDARMTEEQRQRGRRRLVLASVLQYTVPGVPCIYYGDEAGMEGYRDPFCRRTFPWGNEDGEILAHYRRLGQIRHRHSALCDGEPDFITAANGVVLFARRGEDETVYVAVNAGCEPYSLPAPLIRGKTDFLSGKPVPAVLPPESAVIF